jgi:hypothetical protein
MLNDDPVVERVRATRKAIALECGDDLHSLLEWARRIEAGVGARVRRYERKPADHDDVLPGT